MNEHFTLSRHATASNPDQRMARPHNRAPLYLIAFVAGSLASVALLWCATTVLSAVDRLPPPPVSGTWCIDSRFAWLKRTPSWRDATIIAVGSSATFRNLNFEVTSAAAKKQGVMNLAPCFLRMNQTRYLTEYLVGRAKSPKTVITVVAPRDFEGCSRSRSDFFDPDVADQYIDTSGSGWWLYFRNLRFNDIVSHALYAHERKSEFEFDAFGSGPLVRDTPDAGYVFKPEIACFSQLRDLANWLESKGIQFIVATFPVMQAWSERHDPQKTTQRLFLQNVESALANTRATLVDGLTNWSLPDSAFTDPVHLQWPETADFTRFVWRSALQQGARLPRLTQEDSQSAHRIGSANDRWGHLVNRKSLEEMPIQVNNAPSPTHKLISTNLSVPLPEVPINSPLVDAVNQNTPGYSEAFATGVPRSYSWCAGSYKPPNHTEPPAGFTEVTAWGAVYPKLGTPVLPSVEGAIEIANAKTYVYLKTQKKWVVVQDQARLRMAGSHFIADFAPQPGIRMKLERRAGNAVAISSPPAGYNAHFWPYERGKFDAETVDGVYVQMDMRVTDPNMTYVANVGADWWRDPTAGFVEGFANNPGAGMSNWIELLTQWKTLRFYSWDTPRLQADPPPPLLEKVPPISAVRRLNDSSAHCVSQSKP